MKLTEKLKNKRLIMAAAGLVSIAGLFAAPLSQAGWWFSWHERVGPRPVYYHPGYRDHRFHHRRVWVRRSCWRHHCVVREREWVRR